MYQPRTPRDLRPCATSTWNTGGGPGDAASRELLCLWPVEADALDTGGDVDRCLHDLPWAQAALLPCRADEPVLVQAQPTVLAATRDLHRRQQPGEPARRRPQLLGIQAYVGP